MCLTSDSSSLMSRDQEITGNSLLLNEILRKYLSYLLYLLPLHVGCKICFCDTFLVSIERTCPCNKSPLYPIFI